MSGHVIAWEFDSDYVRGKVVCEEPEGADCRLGPQDYRTCQCERWTILRDDDAPPYHYADGGDGALGDRHYMADSGECQIALFINESDLEESCADRATFEIGRTPIEGVWQGDYYDWKRVAS